MTLKKFLLILLVSLTTHQSFGMAGGRFLAGDNKQCYVDDHPVARDEFWFCGPVQNSCTKENIKSNKYSLVHNYTHGQNFKYNNRTFWCCNGTPTTKGYFVEGSTWSTSETKRIELSSGGSCSYTITKDVCGNTTGEKCTKRDDCKSDEIERNGKCTKPCESPMVFKSTSSNECVTCETTNYQTIVSSTTGDYCLTCDKDTEFIKKTHEQISYAKKVETVMSTRGTLQQADLKLPVITDLTTTKLVTKCVPKSSFKQYSMQDMKKCWRCDGSDNFKKCLDGETPHKYCPENYTGEN
ncbi:MAG: hypothetical protein IJS34_01225 [Alphaproteobacteria bacterium]|nr:hypothetical protein [Alphaproteobacteria bacterium]